MKLTGKEYWRSLDQLAETEEFKAFLENEFPKGTAELHNDNSWSRRSFLTTMGASLALAGLAGCRRPAEKIVPYVTRPEEIEPGVPNYYASSMTIGDSAYGVLVTCREGRPIKIEGNKLHPSSGGAVNPWVQASILNLYDPDRSKSVLEKGAEKSWEEFSTYWATQHSTFVDSKGEGLAVLSEEFSSPTMARLKKDFEKKFPNARWVTWEPLSNSNIYDGIEVATGKKLKPEYHFDNAKVILSLESDFMAHESDSIAASRQFADGRRVSTKSDNMNRLYMVEASLSTTGMMADHRLRLKSSQIPAYLAALAKELNSKGNLGLKVDLPDAKSKVDSHWISALADDLLANRGNCLIVAGRRQPVNVHALVCVLNRALTKAGEQVTYVEREADAVSSLSELTDLVSRLNSGSVSTLIMLGGNPVYNAPVDLGFSASLSKAKEVIHLADRLNESAKKADWHIPRAHYLESWGDTRSSDGTVGVTQPMIEPLFGGHSDVEFLSLFVTGLATNPHDIVQETWKKILGNSNFENNWKRVLHDGVSSKQIRKADATPSIKRFAYSAGPSKSDSLEIGFYSSVAYDGRFANNGWLQELPDGITKVAWDNVATVSKATADRLRVVNGDLVNLEVGGHSLEVAVWISPGQADDFVAIGLGYGRSAAGRVGNGVGFDSYRLRTSANPYFASDLKITKTGRTYMVACTQDHGSMEGRPIIRETSLAGYKDDGEFYPEEIESPPPIALWKEHTYDEGYQWGMSIDLNACNGCNACVVACQSENNIPVIGKEQVHNGREMHWMRMDRYYSGTPEEPEVSVQPMACQHCEMAPCESVCPVAATVHDDEGLNVMVYNRCIGTRYCSNNCPYKVRRFNFFNYTNDLPETVKMVQNPEVTVRFRGVMEKCTYCVQRINKAKIHAKNEGRDVADGEIVTACQQACPSKAIVFGNIRDPKSEVAKLKKNDRMYRVLEDLNVRPRTSYLAKLRNPNPAFPSSKKYENKEHNNDSSHDDGHSGHEG